MPINPLHKVKTLLKERSINLTGKRTLLAVSGGMDSVAMIELFHQLGFKFGIAHCNFQLREEESDMDESFVKSLAERYKVPFHTIRFDTAEYMQRKKVTVQLAARELRYEWFEKVRSEHKYDLIAIAHHLNDNIETVLYNFIKGTGVKGLRGMMARQNKLLRPMLSLSREDIKLFVDENKLAYREDSSNASDKYTRNKIRHHLLPLVEEINPGFVAGFEDRLKVFADLENLYDAQIRKTDKQLFEKRGEDIYIPVRRLKKLPNKRSVLYEYLQPHGFTSSQVDDMLASMDSHSGKQFFATNARVVKDRLFLILTQNIQEDTGLFLINEDDKEIRLKNATLQIQIGDAGGTVIKKDKAYASIDAGKLEFPLIIRHWRKGDYFYPFGMALKKKKVSKYFKDQKIPIHEKETIWILESNKKVVWVVGERIDERFKIGPGTQSVMVLKVLKTT